DETWYGEAHTWGEPVGAVTDRAAAETGLHPGTPVVMATRDALCNFVGAGLTEPGIILDQAGTTEIVAAVTSNPLSNCGYPVRHLIPNLWLTSLAPLYGVAPRWFRDQFLPSGSTFETLHALAAQAPPGAASLIFLPSLRGEKGIVHDPTARGVFVGLSTQHGTTHLARAILEGTAFGLRQIIEKYEAGGAGLCEIRIAGGGAHSSLWNQIKADVLGRPVAVLRVLETGCLGAATLAGVGVGLYPDLRQASASLNSISEWVVPDPQRHEYYSALYEIYQQLYPALKPLFAPLAALPRVE
ncbi:MAG TPA: FGGY-family carbohydrate kinase, partial [Anaerolineae bacterium]|nr:FGGY-family carbohydrate kinase [Anaerolineae bacterium]